MFSLLTHKVRNSHISFQWEDFKKPESHVKWMRLDTHAIKQRCSKQRLYAKAIPDYSFSVLVGNANKIRLVS